MLRAIIPCAGYGTRMNMKPHEAKELLSLGPNGESLIKHKLDLCKKYGLDPLVISRKEKEGLNSYLKDNGVDTQIIKPSAEWTNTIRQSSPYWTAHNILILPDSHFTDEDTVITEIKMQLITKNDIVFSLHEVTDSSQWGIVKNNQIIEKPTFSQRAWAWGLIGFTRSSGALLFEGLDNNQMYDLTNHTWNCFRMKSFKDVTR